MEKRIPFVKFGRKQKSIVMFNPQRVKEWIEENSHEPQLNEVREVQHIKTRKNNKKNLESFVEFVSSL
jgi:hypothetical protein